MDKFEGVEGEFECMRFIDQSNGKLLGFWVDDSKVAKNLNLVSKVLKAYDDPKLAFEAELGFYRVIPNSYKGRKGFLCLFGTALAPDELESWEMNFPDTTPEYIWQVPGLKEVYLDSLSNYQNSLIDDHELQRILSEIIQKEPTIEDASFFFWMGANAKALGDLRKAECCFIKSWQIDRKFPEFHINNILGHLLNYELGEIAFESKNMNIAKRHFEGALHYWYDSEQESHKIIKEFIRRCDNDLAISLVTPEEYEKITNDPKWEKIEQGGNTCTGGNAVLQCYSCDSPSYLNYCPNCKAKVFRIERHNVLCSNCLNSFESYICPKCNSNVEIKMAKAPLINHQKKEIFAQSMKDSKACFVATSIYGSSQCEEVLILKKFRDVFLIQSFLGRLFINYYYSISPFLIKILNPNCRYKHSLRKLLSPIVIFARVYCSINKIANY